MISFKPLFVFILLNIKGFSPRIFLESLSITSKDVPSSSLTSMTQSVRFDSSGLKVVEAKAKIFLLTKREFEVLYWNSYGKKNWEISQVLSMSPRTANKLLE